MAAAVLDEDDDDELAVHEPYIMLNVWNTGRAEITVRFLWMTFHHGKSLMLLPRKCIDYDGPEETTWIPGHSAEEWFIDRSYSA